LSPDIDINDLLKSEVYQNFLCFILETFFSFLLFYWEVSNFSHKVLSGLAQHKINEFFCET
jgi:hypothetical protein